MANVIVYKRPDGGVSIIVPVDQSLTLEQVIERSLPPGTPHKIVDDATLISDRTFRDAWVADDNHDVSVHMPKAREIHKQKLRHLREPLLAKLDVEYQKADENGDAQLKKQIADQKKALRDVTDHPSIEAAQTPEALKLAIPEVLK